VIKNGGFETEDEIYSIHLIDVDGRQINESDGKELTFPDLD
jgi:hypothetical protein